MLDHSCQVQRRPLAERGLDLYETPPVAVEALVRCEKLPHKIWEPSAGNGTIVHVLRKHGHSVIASDIFDYGGLNFVGDFLKQKKPPPNCTAIVTNPPYVLCARSAPFVRHALELAPTVVLLMRLAFYEANARTDILEKSGLQSVHVFRKRLPMMHRDGWEGRRSNSGMAFAWMRWQRNFKGPTTIDRISW